MQQDHKWLNAGATKKFTLVDSPKKLHWLFSVLGNSSDTSVDIETNHPTSDSAPKFPRSDVVIGGMSFSWATNEAAYLPLYTGIDKNTTWKDPRVFNLVKEKLRNFLEDDNSEKSGQNFKFDMTWIWEVLKIKVRGFTFDTMLAHHLLDEEGILTCRHGLKPMAAYYLDPKANQYEQDLQKALEYYDPKYRRYTAIPTDILYPYACGDADYTRQLKPIFYQQMEEQGLLDLFYDYTMQIQQSTMLAEIAGLPIDLSRLDELDKFYINRKAELELQIHEAAGQKFDVTSPQQLADILYNKLGLPIQKSKKNTITTDKEALQNLKGQHPIIELMIESRSVEKLHGSYVIGIRDRYDEKTVRIHPRFLIHGTKTGRLASEDPNVQNMPRPENGGTLIKSMFIPPAGFKLITADYSQIELRIAAHVSKEPAWILAFKNDEDLHSATAKTCFKLDCDVDDVKKLHAPIRTKAKGVNFGVLYGSTEYGLAESLGISVDEAREFLANYFKGLPTLANWIDSTHKMSVELGYVVSPIGRRRRLPDAQLWVPPKVYKPQGAPKCFGDTKESPSVPLFKEHYNRIDLKESLPMFQETSIFQQQTSSLRNRKFEKCQTCPLIGQCILAVEQNRRKRKVDEAMRQGPNAIIQGFASDLACKAFTDVIVEAKRHEIPLVLKSEDGDGIQPALLVHDDIGFFAADRYVEPATRLIKDTMENAYPECLVPLIAEPAVSERWSDK